MVTVDITVTVDIAVTLGITIAITTIITIYVNGFIIQLTNFFTITYIIYDCIFTYSLHPLFILYLMGWYLEEARIIDLLLDID
jgi:hypothetical protein